MPLKFRQKKTYETPDLGRIESFISGKVCEIFAKKGEEVKRGDKLLILEAMKMRNVIISPVNGKIVEVAIPEHSKVSKGDLLIQIDAVITEEVEEVTHKDEGPSSSFTDDQ